jgi:rhamnosyltransferase
LEGIRQQKEVGEIEIVVVDSASKDRTREIAKEAGAKVFKIHRQDFNHGGTRNLAISETKGEFVALLTQDAFPENERWLSALVETLLEDPTVSGAYSRHLPNANTPPWVLRQMQDHGVLSEEKYLQFLDKPESYHVLEPLQRLRLCTFDNVSSLIRRSAWEKHRFPEVPFAEDLEWARDEILRGNKIVYQPDSRVIHSHRPNPFQEFRRAKIAHQRLVELFNLRLVPTFPLLFRYGCKNISQLTGWALEEHPIQWRNAFEAPFVAMASTLGQYSGAKSAGRKYGVR